MKKVLCNNTFIEYFSIFHVLFFIFILCMMQLLWSFFLFLFVIHMYILKKQSGLSYSESMKKFVCCSLL